MSTQTRSGNTEPVITVELHCSWNKHLAKAGAVELLGDGWAKRRIYSIQQFDGCNGPYFSIFHGSQGAYAEPNVRNLMIDGEPVALPKIGEQMISEYTVSA